MRRAILPAIAAALVAAAPASAEVARIKHAQGQAFVKRGAATLPARIGQQLQAKDRLATGKDGRLSLTFIDDTRFAVGPNSEVEVAKFDYDRRSRTGDFITKVDRGSLAVVSGRIAKSRRDAMQVRTPKTWLGVRGTRFVVTVAP